jgi:hypothetical protein
MRLEPLSALRAAAAGLLVLAWSPDCLRADTVVLRTGEVFSGRILRASSEEVSIQLESGGIVSFRANRVEQIRQLNQKDGGSDTILYNTPGKPPAPERTPGPDPALTVRPVDPPSPRPEPQSSPPDLSSFPLHARRAAGPGPSAGGAAAAKPEPPAVASRRVHDASNGYSLVPPLGFKPMSDPRLPAGHRGFLEPATQANITVNIYDSQESLDQIKDSIVTLLPRRTSGKVVRESRRELAGPGGYQGWLLEIENTVSDTNVRQLEFLVKSGGKIYIVTCSATAKNYPRVQQAFEGAVESFRLEVAKPEDGDLPPQVQSYLKKSQEQEATPPSESPSRINPERFKPQIERPMERIDQLMRVAPLRPYTITP